jgi:hypothetical protein
MCPNTLINLINKSFKVFIGNSFQLIRSKYNTSSFITEGKSSALNIFPNETEEVKVIEWFENFWLFLKITFKTETKKINRKIDTQINTLISLSVFQGENFDNKKTQLFRAEWDDYNNPEEKHAQPHWHITSSQTIENIFGDDAFFSIQPEILLELKKRKENIFDVSKIHFAMNADWQKINGTYIHKIDEEKEIVRWLQELITYLRTELESYA